MPREKIGDGDRHIEVSWKRWDAELPGNGYVQVSTHDEQSRAIQLLGDGHRINSALMLAAECEEQPGRDLMWLHAEWCWKLDNFHAELTGSYVTLEPTGVRSLLDTLHKANRQSREPEAGSAAALGATGPGTIYPAVTPPSMLPPPGATGYPVAGRHAIPPDAP
jgi:hypothetical protein